MVKEKRKLNNAEIKTIIKPYNDDMERYIKKLIEDSDKEMAKYFPFPPFTESEKNFIKFKTRTTSRN